MSSLRPQDRKSLCRFTFSDGRQCRTPRSPHHPYFCSDHARKDSQARAADKLARELSYFFSGQYLSACDLSAALGRLLPAVVRSDIKPRSTRALACLSQTLAQTIPLSKHEYINAFGTDAWRQAIRNSVRQNFNHRQASPPPQPPPDRAPPVVAGLHRLRKKSLSSLKSAVMLSLSALLAWRFLGLCQTVSFTTWIGRLPSVGASRFSRGEQFLQPDQIRCGGV